MALPTKSNNTSVIKCNEKTRQVLEWLVEGNNAEDVKAAIKKFFPKEKPEKLLSDALGYLAEIGTSDTDVLKGWCYESYRLLYQKMVAIGDYAGAIKATKAIENLIK